MKKITIEPGEESILLAGNDGNRVRISIEEVVREILIQFVSDD